jgi:acyl-CoA hydrolase
MKYVSADEAVKLINSGDAVFFQGDAAVPELIQEALARRASELKGVQIYSGFNITSKPAPFTTDPAYKDVFIVNSLFPAPDIRKWINDGWGSMIPAFLGEVPGLFRRKELPLDVTVINCSLPDENGYCSYGVAGDITVSAVECASRIIAQVNKSVPYLYGECLIHESKIDAAVLCDVPCVDMKIGEPSPIEEAIGRYIAAEIPDGACLQIGVGGIPNATMNALKDHKHLGLHTEAMTDGAYRLMELGVIDNSLKKVHPGVGTASFCIGSKDVYKAMHKNPSVRFYDCAYTNDPFIIRQNPKACAINSAIEVDLTGQICADSIGEIIYSSIGGQHDFMYGCSLSEGGKTFIALQSRTNRGESKIVPTLKVGAGVVTTRFQTQYVATEWGIVYLRNKNLAQRAKALISIAHPDDREALEKAACERFGYSFLRLKEE